MLALDDSNFSVIKLMFALVLVAFGWFHALITQFKSSVCINDSLDLSDISFILKRYLAIYLFSQTDKASLNFQNISSIAFIAEFFVL